jgi:hypothetical protein
MTTLIPTVGTISHGTLRTEDLLVAFADALNTYGSGEGNAKLVMEAFEAVQAMTTNIIDGDEASEIVAELEDSLDEIAAQHGLCFGAHEGDGSDFGFWPIPESDENQP